MFQNIIERSQTAFTSGAADTIFPTIEARVYHGDASLEATLRAFLGHRFGEGVRIEAAVFSRSEKCNAALSPAEKIQSIMGEISCDEVRDALYIIDLCGDSDTVSDNFRIVEANFTGVYPMYKQLEKVRTFFRQSFRTDCYISEELKVAILFVDNLTVRKYHYLQTAVSVVLPWVINPKEISPLEMELVRSFHEQTSDQYLSVLNKMAQDYDFRGANIRTKLKGFETQYAKAEQERLTCHLSELASQMEELNNKIRVTYRDIDDTNIRLLGLQQRILEKDSSDSEIMEYFIANKQLILEKTEGDEITFIVRDYFTYFDQEQAEAAINNKDSFCYSRARNNESRTKMKKLLTEIFVADHPRIRIKTCAAYAVQLAGGVRGIKHYDFPVECADDLPNPHINNYRCLGSQRESLINQILTRGDYIGAIEQCVGSGKNLNFGDYTVMSDFMSSMWKSYNGDNKKKFLELPGGVSATVPEAVKWLEEQGGAVE